MPKEYSQYRLTRIVATLGPASSSPETIRRLIETGVDVFRLNFSHGNHETHKQSLQEIRRISSEMNVTTSILQDISGPKLRIMEVENGSVILKTGASIRLQADLNPGNENAIGYIDEGWADALKTGHRVIIGDGGIVLKVISGDSEGFDCEIVSGGTVRSKWGLTFPDSDVKLRAITDKDRRDIEFGCSLGVDAMALSFVRDQTDIRHAKDIIKPQNVKPLLIAKIEQPCALEYIDEILAESDGLMVARGDLGLSIPLEKIPTVQKRLIRLCRDRGKFVITATQMLESMTTNPQPTRAEVTDVANAVYDGTDAVMLSGETAVGHDPVAVVETMSRILYEAEPNLSLKPCATLGSSIEEAIVVAAANLTKELEARVVVVPLTSGSTAQRISRQRLKILIAAGTFDEVKARRMNFWFGVSPVLMQGDVGLVDCLRNVVENVVKRDLAQKGDRLVATGGFPLDRPGVTNFVRAIEVGGEL